MFARRSKHHRRAIVKTVKKCQSYAAQLILYVLNSRITLMLCGQSSQEGLDTPRRCSMETVCQPTTAIRPWESAYMNGNKDSGGPPLPPSSGLGISRCPPLVLLYALRAGCVVMVRTKMSKAGRPRPLQSGSRPAISCLATWSTSRRAMSMPPMRGQRKVEGLQH